jgi:hypothetical protein
MQRRAQRPLKTFQDFRVTHYEDIVDTSDWGKTQARLGRIVAVKE